MKKKAIIVSSMRGGVGKTFVSISLADMVRGAEVLKDASADARGESWFPNLEEMLNLAAEKVTLIDLDVEPGKDKGKSSLSRRFPETIPYAMAPTAGNIMSNPLAVESHFDRLLQRMLEGPVTLLDMGANVVNSWFDWAEASNAAKYWKRDALEIHFVSVTTADSTAFPVAADGIERMVALCEKHGATLHNYLVLNEKDGNFSGYGGSESMKRLERLSDVADSIKLIKNISPLQVGMDIAELVPSQVFRMSDAELVKTFKPMPEIATRRGVSHLLNCYMPFLDTVLRVGLLGDGSWNDITEARAAGSAPGAVAKGKVGKEVVGG